jgi:protein TonB
VKDTREHPSRALGFLSRYHDGELSPEEAADFDRHARGCAECRTSAAEYEAVLAMYREAGSSEADASLAARISRRIDTEVRHRAPVRYVTLQVDLLWASVVAVGLVGVLAVYGIFGRRKPPRGPTIVAEKAAPAPPAAVREPVGEESPAAQPSPAPPKALRSSPRFSPESPSPARASSSVSTGSPSGSASSPASISSEIAAAPAPVSKEEASDSRIAAAPQGRSAGAAPLRDAGPEPLRVGGPVTAPVLIRRVDPVIPEAMRRRIVSASPVVVEAVITETGDVTRMKVIRSNPPFDAAVIRALSQWRYRPAELDGKPVSVYLTVTLSIDVH